MSIENFTEKYDFRIPIDDVTEFEKIEDFLPQKENKSSICNNLSAY